MAKMTNTNYKYLSKTINSKTGFNFVSYINKYRVEEAKDQLRDKNLSHYTIEAIGEMCGFKSKSAFNGAFKKITQVTPSVFKKS